MLLPSPDSLNLLKKLDGESVTQGTIQKYIPKSGCELAARFRRKQRKTKEPLFVVTGNGHGQSVHANDAIYRSCGVTPSTLDGFSRSMATLIRNTHTGKRRGIQTMIPILSKSTAPKP